jgi:hypothetical protein
LSSNIVSPPGSVPSALARTPPTRLMLFDDV